MLLLHYFTATEKMIMIIILFSSHTPTVKHNLFCLDQLLLKPVAFLLTTKKMVKKNKLTTFVTKYFRILHYE